MQRHAFRTQALLIDIDDEHENFCGGCNYLNKVCIHDEHFCNLYKSKLPIVKYKGGSKIVRCCECVVEFLEKTEFTEMIYSQKVEE